MSKKIIILALAAVTAAMYAMPATASATLVSLHMNPTPAKIDISGGAVIRRTNSGTLVCNGVSGTATPEAGGTTGTIQLTLGPDCTGPGGGNCTSSNPAHTPGSITTTVLPYHLVTLDAHGGASTHSNSLAGILITPNASGAYAHYNCIVLGFPVQITLEGNGLLGTITAPECGKTSTHAMIDFNAAGATTTQTHTYTHNSDSSKTTGIWTLTKGGANASLEAEATLTATNASGQVVETEIVCT